MLGPHTIRTWINVLTEINENFILSFSTVRGIIDALIKSLITLDVKVSSFIFFILLFIVYKVKFKGLASKGFKNQMKLVTRIVCYTLLLSGKDNYRFPIFMLTSHVKYDRTQEFVCIENISFVFTCMNIYDGNKLRIIQLQQCKVFHNSM